MNNDFETIVEPVAHDVATPVTPQPETIPLSRIVEAIREDSLSIGHDFVKEAIVRFGGE